MPWPNNNEEDSVTDRPGTIVILCVHTAMQAYLAEKYMSGPKAEAILSRVAPEKKKKKRKADEAGLSGGGHLIKDEDENGGWSDPRREEADEDAADVPVASDRSFKKRKAGEGWETVREGIVKDEKSPPPPPDEQPTVVIETDALEMGGLLSAAQVKKKFGKKEVAKVEKPPEEEETIYRDASGRKIDTKAERAEAARLRREKEEREAKKMEWGKGLVQRDEEERKRIEYEKEKSRGLARYADDKDLNEEQKARERWNDPAAAFLTKRTSKGPRRPTYNGPTPPPNRFGIKPGYRWDGVDRSNGFEKKLFQSLNARKRSGNEAHAWSVEDM